jgi:hypothetical protein
MKLKLAELFPGTVFGTCPTHEPLNVMVSFSTSPPVYIQVLLTFTAATSVKEFTTKFPLLGQ